jgi:UDP-N-acetylglucosamine acyltransferase
VNQRIHPTVLIDPTAAIGDDVVIGPFAIVGPDVTIGRGCHIAARVTLEQNVRLGVGVRVGGGSILGGPPQDVKYGGDETWVTVGDHTQIREFATINRATTPGGITSVGRDCFIMTYVHIAHDCRVGDGVIMANATQLAGHVTVEDHVVISGLVAIHQFARIGEYAFIGGMTRVSQDIPPFVKAVGNPVELYGLNTIGLQRHNMPAATIADLKRAYRLCFNSDLNLGQALERARTDLPGTPEVDRFLEFVSSSQRGVPA